MCCGFLAFVRWDLISRGWLGLLTLYVPGSEFALADELGRRRHHRVRRAVVSGRVKVRGAVSVGRRSRRIEFRESREYKCDDWLPRAVASSYLDPGTTFFPGVFLSCVSAVSLLIVLTSWDSSGAQLTCALGLLCCGDISRFLLGCYRHAVDLWCRWTGGWDAARVIWRRSVAAAVAAVKVLTILRKRVRWGPCDGSKRARQSMELRVTKVVSEIIDYFSKH